MLNKIMLIGNLGRDPEMRYTATGIPVTNFSLATNRRYTSTDGERREETEWFNVDCWNNLAEQVNQYLSKGRKCYVEGRLHLDSFQGRDGETRYQNKVTASQVIFLEGPSTAEQRGEQNGELTRESGLSDSTSPDDLPF